MRHFPIRTLVLCIALLHTTPSQAQITPRVPADFQTIQAAINAAANGDTVIVAPGIYRENINFRGKLITLRSDAGPDATTIDGGATDVVVTFSTGEGASAVISGFTIRNGR